MDGAGLSHENDPETAHNHPSKRRKTFHNGAPSALSPDHYTIAWICALHIEMAAARAMLDEIHPDPPRQLNDSNSYTLGSIKQHNIVIACLPTSQYGTNNAATVLANMLRTFTKIRMGLMVGIGGGAPSRADVRLGDIVVGTRVMQYDLGKVIRGGNIQRTAIPKIPDYSLRTVVSNLRAQHELQPSRVPSILRDKMERYAGYGRPSTPDRLFQASYEHESPTTTCDQCDQSKLAPRSTRISNDPVIHYGAIASGNQVMKDATTRDSVARELDIVCFEMEAAGLMDVLPCLPIRGVCDYSDSHKAKKWQRYAAAAAAAYARELLEGTGCPAVDGEVPDTQNMAPVRPNVLLGPDRHQRLLDSLRFDQIDSRKTSIKAAHAKTCHWFLTHPDYQAWLDPQEASQHHGFLWLRGKPGVGKSTIMKFIYLRTKKKDRREHTRTASFFFNARGEDLEKSVPGMYRSLLLQLLEGFPDLQQVLDDPDLVPPSQTNCPSLNMLKDLFRSAVSALGQRSFTCFVDALDECDEQQIMDMVQYFEELAELSTSNGIRLQICFSSRHYPYIDIKLGIRHTMESQQGHIQDLENYIQSQLRIRDTTLAEELRPQILEKSAGVFLWVVLVVDILNKENRRGRLALRKRLEEVPSGLTELFKDILRRDAENMEDLQLCILWILYAKRPLTPREYHHALWSGLAAKGLADAEIPDATASDARECADMYVITSSKGLAEITKSKQPTVQFIHESVRDFLIKDGGLLELWPDLGFNWKSPSHETLKKCCSYYMNQPCVPTSVAKLVSKTRPDHLRAKMSKLYPFLEYASQHVLHHSNAAADVVCQRGFLAEFPIPDWVSIVNIFEKYQSRRYTPSASLLYILAERGLPALIRSRLRDDPRIDFPGERYGYPLWAALAAGGKECVGALLGLPSVIVEGVGLLEGFECRRDFDGSNFTPLSWASQQGCTVIVRHFLEKGVSIDEADKSGRTPLMRASEHGQLAVAKVLVENGADVNASYRGGSELLSPILLALNHGHEDLMRLLIENGTDVNSRDGTDKSLLCLAVERKQEGVVRLLIEKGADIDTDISGNTPLDQALRNGHGAIASALLEGGANIQLIPYLWPEFSLSSIDPEQVLPIHRLGIALLLLEKGAVLRDRETALTLASAHDHQDLIRFLVKNGADIHACDQHGKTALDYALRGNEAVVKLLIENGVDINARVAHGNTPLSTALGYDEDAIARLLIDQGADINAPDAYGTTPLYIASIRGRKAIVRLLIDQGADINDPGPHGTPLQNAIQLEKQGLARLLIKKGADVNICNREGKAPLHEAISIGLSNTAALLIEKGADINARDNSGRTPLHEAVSGQLTRTATLLVKKGADVNARDDSGTTPLQQALLGNHKQLVAFLVEKGAKNDVA